MIAAANLPEIIASRYRPIRLIATGGMGAVYEVEHAHTGERLALKVLILGVGSSPEAIERFKREARASTRIKSEHVVRVTDADVAPELGGAPFLVMELLDGMNIERAALAAAPSPATVVDWLRQVAQAIDKAHGLGIVHRDLKPENLFLANIEDRGPVVKVLDFGIAKLMEDGTGATGTGQLLGTPKYMAPEQASANGPITPATDRYALGLIAYRLLTGEGYYQGGVMSILGQLLHGQLQPPSERACGLGGAFDAWFLKACHRNPDERFASASEQIEALAEALGLPRVGGASGDATLPATTVPLPTSQRATTSPRALLTARRVVLATAVLAAVSIGAVAASRFGRTSKVAEAVCGLPNRSTTAACAPCMAQACCKEAEACSAIQGCVQVETCVRACASGEAMCRARCYASKGEIAQLQQGVESCRATHCANECLSPQWECLGRVKWQMPSLMARTITIKTSAYCASCGTGGGHAPMAGATVRVCSIADPKCDFPLASSTTDGSGAVSLKVDATLYPPPLAIFLEYRKEGFLDTLYHLNTPPVTGDLDVGGTPLLDPRVNAGGLARMLGTTYDPTRAQAGTRPADCNGQFATKQVAVTWLDRDDQTATTPYFAYAGSAIATNLPISAAGITRVVARVAETNQLIATTSIVVRPRATSFVGLVPTP